VERDEEEPQAPLRLFTKDELAKFDGKTSSRIYLAILGQVFDVTKKKDTYGPGGSYAFFAGRDGTRAFTTGEFKEEGLTDDTTGLSTKQLLDIQHWFDFYRKSPVRLHIVTFFQPLTSLFLQEYPRVGYLEGSYYDNKGKPTDALRTVRKIIKEAKQEKDKEEEAMRQFPSCNSRWSKESGGELWCTTLSGGIKRDWEGVPRLYHKPGNEEVKCVCVRTAEEAAANPYIKPYEGCDPHATRCKRG